MQNPVLFAFTGIAWVALTGMLFLNRQRGSVWLTSIYEGILSSTVAGLGFAAPELYSYPIVTAIGGWSVMLSGIFFSYLLQKPDTRLTTDELARRERNNTKTLIYASVMAVLIIAGAVFVGIGQAQRDGNTVQRSWLDVMLQFSRELRDIRGEVNNVKSEVKQIKAAQNDTSLAGKAILKNQRLILKNQADQKRNR